MDDYGFSGLLIMGDESNPDRKTENKNCAVSELKG